MPPCHIYVVIDVSYSTSFLVFSQLVLVIQIYGSRPAFSVPTQEFESEGINQFSESTSWFAYSTTYFRFDVQLKYMKGYIN